MRDLEFEVRCEGPHDPGVRADYAAGATCPACGRVVTRLVCTTCLARLHTAFLVAHRADRGGCGATTNRDSWEFSEVRL
ncbi:MAG: hypothetical protein HGA44_20755 [Cellulomonadaceae bacterium]|nr:hypothetical protein [Cellulomonadaceae bacterium]